ncbi:hypothetical protein LR48_Vigan05g108000 [Vigna angularis]|uniref:Uncharacterized protein n=1 Tax=Phaseolus angularis TaxID=3914 RepID=A0A0L9ULC1_PHAAN|nr:hypothetical protein LR48_Vigan05g108000 [Vigna angularis]
MTSSSGRRMKTAGNKRKEKEQYYSNQFRMAAHKRYFPSVDVKKLLMERRVGMIPTLAPQFGREVNARGWGNLATYPALDGIPIMKEFYTNAKALGGEQETYTSYPSCEAPCCPRKNEKRILKRKKHPSRAGPEGFFTWAEAAAGILNVGPKHPFTCFCFGPCELSSKLPELIPGAPPREGLPFSQPLNALPPPTRELFFYPCAEFISQEEYAARVTYPKGPAHVDVGATGKDAADEEEDSDD